jgi:hypothetical protein
LSAREVAPLLAPLPNNVHIWRFKNGDPQEPRAR